MSSSEEGDQQSSATSVQASSNEGQYIPDSMSSNSTMKATRLDYPGYSPEQSSKRQRNSEDSYTALPYRPQSGYASTPPLFTRSVRTFTDSMSDGKNVARSIRVLEIMNDFRTVQQHIRAQVTRPEASPPDQASMYLDGYVVLRQANANAQAILSSEYNPGSLGLESGAVPDTEVQKATLQRIILDASARRFQAHKIYLQAAAGMRWILARKQIDAMQRPAAQKQQAHQAVNQRLQTELAAITDESVINDLRSADTRKGYWLDEDPSLSRILAWVTRTR